MTLFTSKCDEIIVTIRKYLKLNLLFRLISEKRDLVGAVRISDWFNRPLLLEMGQAFDDLARGLTVQQQDFSDQFWDSEMTQFLFRSVHSNDLYFKQCVSQILLQYDT